MVGVTKNKLAGLKPKDKLYRVNCGDGLLLEVTPQGSKLWRFRFRHAGRDTMVALGEFPKISLKHARELRDEQLELLESGEHPAEVRRRDQARDQGEHTFETVARHFFKQKATKSASADSLSRFELWVFKYIGDRDVQTVTFKDLLSILNRLEKAEVHETARRVRADISRVMRFARARGLVDADPTPEVQALPPRDPTPFPNPPQKLVAEILRAIDGYEGGVVVRIAMQLLPRLLCRPGELRNLRWSEVHKDEIRLPDSKSGLPHIIPLSTQCQALFEQLHEITGEGKLCFPSTRTAERPISDATINAGLRRLGFTSEQVVGHSFRKVGSTALHEQGYDSQWIERQLGHTDRDKIRAVYSHAQFLEQRRQMMQEWSDFLDALKKPAE